MGESMDMGTAPDSPHIHTLPLLTIGRPPSRWYSIPLFLPDVPGHGVLIHIVIVENMLNRCTFELHLFAMIFVEKNKFHTNL